MKRLGIITNVVTKETSDITSKLCMQLISNVQNMAIKLAGSLATAYNSEYNVKCGKHFPKSSNFIIAHLTKKLLIFPFHANWRIIHIKRHRIGPCKSVLCRNATPAYMNANYQLIHRAASSSN